MTWRTAIACLRTCLPYGKFRTSPSGWRLPSAQLLKSQATYTEIVEKTGVSTATIGRVNRALNYGAGGYQRVLERLNQGKKSE